MAEHHKAGKPFFLRIAADLMSRDVLLVPQEMSLPEAARLLSQAQISGAPVVDAQGCCVGVLSATDFVHWAEKHDSVTVAGSAPLPRTCSFQMKQRDSHGKELVLCTLPPGACSLQLTQRGPGGGEQIVCREPHSVPTDWQVVEMDDAPAGQVRHYMTTDVVTVRAETPLRDLARMMLDAHIHRVIVVDGQCRPIGIVSSTDILAAVANAPPVA